MSARKVSAAIPLDAAEVVNIARCPEHGLHGERTECFECGAPMEQVPMVPVRVVTAEPCACGCTRPRTGGGAYHADACRTKHWKERTAYVDPRSANGPNGAQLRLLQARRRPSGRQIAYGRAVRTLAAWLADTQGYSEQNAHRVAEHVLHQALPARQRNPRPRVSDDERRAA